MLLTTEKEAAVALCCSSCSRDFTGMVATALCVSGLTGTEVLEGEGTTRTFPVSLILKPGDLCPFCFAGTVLAVPNAQDTELKEVIA
jgi:hypothetical protein